MPKIACPGCRKVYQLPDSAFGKSATCKKCGKKFRINAPKREAVAASAAPSTPAKPKPPLPREELSRDDQAFWSDSFSIPEETAAKPKAETHSSPHASRSEQAGGTDSTPKKNRKRKKKKGGIKWGVQWEKVLGGLVTFLVAGGITLGLVVSTGRLFFWPAGAAVFGLITMLSGLMGEEGIW